MFRPAALHDDADPVARALLRISQNTLVVVLGLMPILFIPVAYAPLQYTKVLFVLVGVIVALIFYALSVLREGEVSLAIPLPLIAFWGIVATYVISTLLSGDLKDAFVGNAMEVHTTAFMLLLAAIASVSIVLRGSKVAVMRLYAILIGSSVVLALYHIVRVLVGPEVLSLGVFTAPTASPLGSWNGLALYFGLVVLLALVAFEQLQFSKVGKWLLGAAMAFALVMLAIVNYFAVWVVLAVVSTVMLIYTLARKHYQRTESMVTERGNGSFVSIVVSTVLLIISLLFIFGGSSLAAFIAERTDIQYIEVRPSMTATFDMARNVYQESPLFGVGPNRFADVWRQYKDPSINQTIFWNSTFESGSGYIPTAMVTAGALALIAWVVFLALFLVAGFRMIFRATHADRFWSFVGLSSFIAAVYLWGMAFIYTPAPAMLMLAAACTGIFFAAYSVLVTPPRFSLSVAQNRSMGVVFVGAAVLMIFGSVGTLYAAGQHYSALYEFNRTFATFGEDDTLDTLQNRITNAFELSANDIFARRIAEYRLAQMNSLLNVPEPTQEDVASFQNSVTEALNAAQTATELDPTEPQGWQVLGQIYSVLTAADVADAYERATVAFERARQLNPTNPAVVLMQAQLEARNDNIDGARALAEEAIRMKQNYTEALLFLTQIDILNNNVAQAIERTRSIISIEPQNPARYYQYGVLQTAAGDTEQAIAAFERAIALDPQYANARYYLALAYVEQGRRDDALAQLDVVAGYNPDNEQLRDLMERIRAGEPVAQATPSLETDEAMLEDGADVTQEALDETSLVTPVNTVPADGNDEADTDALTEDEEETPTASAAAEAQ